MPTRGKMDDPAELVEHRRMPAGARLFAPAALVMVLGAGSARAQPAAAAVDLTWNAPSDCPSREGVLGEVARLLAASRSLPAQATARADVTRDEQGRWHTETARGTDRPMTEVRDKR